MNDDKCLTTRGLELFRKTIAKFENEGGESTEDFEKPMKEEKSSKRVRTNDHFV